MAKQKETTVNSVLKELLTVEIYKRSQGRYTRQGTAIALGVVAALGCYRLFGTLAGAGVWQYVAPAAILLISLWLSFRVVCIPRFADFLIATEAEMNKVSWPSWSELIRGSAVVLVTIFAMAAVLFGYDLAWYWLLRWLEVIQSTPVS